MNGKDYLGSSRLCYCSCSVSCCAKKEVPTKTETKMLKPINGLPGLSVILLSGTDCN